MLARLIREEQGQDLTEYTLLIAMIALAAAGVFTNAGGSVAGIWTGAGTTVATANSTAAGTTSASAQAPPSGRVHHDH